MEKRRRKKKKRHVYYFYRSIKYYLVPMLIFAVIFSGIVAFGVYYVFHDILLTLAITTILFLILVGSAYISAYLRTKYVFYIDFDKEAVGWKYKFISSKGHNIPFSNINDCYSYQTLGQRIMSRIIGAPIGTVVIKQEKVEDPDIVAKDIMHYDKFEELVLKARIKLREIDTRSAVAGKGNI